MNALSIITRKRDRGKLSRSEIFYLVDQFTHGQIENYQYSAFLMAAFLNGLDGDETFWLTEAMLLSGQTISFAQSMHPVYDKHSTGGVGDKLSLALAPLLASVGIKIAMLSGRGLGHTGGTLDKLASIPGLNPLWTESKIKTALREIGFAISGQTEEIAPADKKIYALRDLTATVESIPLITASILSKKLALKTDGIVFDIKVGSGAFMKTRPQATQLAKSLLSVCSKFHRPAVCVLTDMSEPIGQAVGNYLEILEILDFLATGQPADMREITFELAYELICLKNKTYRRKQFYQTLDNAIYDGRALEKFRQFVHFSGAKASICDCPQDQFKPTIRGRLVAEKSGYLAEYNAELIGRACLALGAGRGGIQDKIDPMAGIIAIKKVGQKVTRGEPLFLLYGSDKKSLTSARQILQDCFQIRKEKIAAPTKIITILK